MGTSQSKRKISTDRISVTRCIYCNELIVDKDMNYLRCNNCTARTHHRCMRTQNQNTLCIYCGQTDTLIPILSTDQTSKK